MANLIKDFSSGDKSTEIDEQKQKNYNGIKIKKPRKSTLKTVYLLLIIVMFTVTLLTWRGIVSKGVDSLVESYNATYAMEYASAYDKWFQSSFYDAEGKYHVSNDVAISIGEIKEIQMLEVLKVSDIEYIVQDKDKSNGNIASWLEVPGEGTYVVNLKEAEFIVDNERRYVLVRAPQPEITNIHPVYSKITKLLFKDDDIFNGNYADGEKLAEKQTQEALILIQKEFAMNQNYYLSAENAARTAIQCLVMQMNPGIDDITIDVEFYQTEKQ